MNMKCITEKFLNKQYESCIVSVFIKHKLNLLKLSQVKTIKAEYCNKGIYHNEQNEVFKHIFTKIKNVIIHFVLLFSLSAVRKNNIICTATIYSNKYNFFNHFVIAY